MTRVENAPLLQAVRAEDRAHRRHERTGLIGWAAVAVLTAYGLAQVYWALGGSGFPFGADDANPEYSAFEHIGRAQLAPWLAAGFLLSAVVAVLLALPGRHRVPTPVLLGATGLSVAGVLGAIADFRILGNLAYVFMLKFSAINWTVINQVFAVVAVGLMAMSAVTYQRRTTGACVACGRNDSGAGWTSPRSAARWGRRAAYTAVAVPLVYASTRWAWAVGYPLGLSDEMWEEGKEDNLWLFGAALATMGALGSLLTLGLVQRWGEVFPRWIPGLRGRRVPPALAIVPASLVAVMVTTAGIMYIRLHFQGAFDNPAENWGATVPETIWPVWGVALAAATLAYYFRRRGACKRCGRGAGGTAAEPEPRRASNSSMSA
ncbi:hypothetical protein [Streptomyces poonensis]|uniref:Uncharacterized protein n=1 Tax=Streptomyces poonensis TaxID=68255 RepID=A0A918PEG0_9ACTN|nr:hypothetical protein [Streptomyces poonensis]GGZ03750.1 hypothetical protein GCM10010365_23310 [Streptomyces poonensis]GLJ90770.1 hypothetical protein GCM10017589_33750 [Streptomyces poonensis]